MKPKSRSSDSWQISESKRLSTSLKSKSKNDTSDKIAIKTKSPIANHLLSMAQSIKKLTKNKVNDVSSPSSLRLRISSDKVGLNNSNKKKLLRQKASSTLCRNKIVDTSGSTQLNKVHTTTLQQRLYCHALKISVDPTQCAVGK